LLSAGKGRIRSELTKVHLIVEGLDMGEELTEQELNAVIEDLCTSKADEFHLIGYEHVTGSEVWECVSDKYKKTGMPALHQVVNDILSLKSTKFMNWLTLSIYKNP
jgi:hypothetical protein